MTAKKKLARPDGISVLPSRVSHADSYENLHLKNAVILTTVMEVTLYSLTEPLHSRA